MGWITKEDGQHIYIGSGGEFQPRGPTAPKGASLREQAAAHRAGKGPAETRRAELLTRAKEAFHKHGEKGPDTERAARLKGGTKKDQAEAKRIEKSYPQHQKEQDILRGRLKPLGHKSLREQAAGAKPADRVHQPGPGGMARTASGLNLHEKMTASAAAASTRAAAARARGDRAGELAAHEHRAIILAKQNDIKGVHKSQFGYARTAPGSEKTAAAALVARVRGGGKAAEPAKPAGASLREQAAAGLPHPSTLLGSSASAGDYAGAARSRAAARAGVQASRASATAAQSRERFARGEHDAAGVYREGAKVVVTGTKTITNPITGKGKVTIPTGVVKIGDRVSKIGDQQAMHLAGKLPRASTNPGERSARASLLLGQRASLKRGFSR